MYLNLIPIYLLAYIFMSYLSNSAAVVTDMDILCLTSGKKSLCIIFPFTMKTTHTGLYMTNTKKRHVNIYTLFLSISQHTYLCPNSRNSATLDTGIEFYVSCQEFFFVHSIFPYTMNTAHTGFYIKNTKKRHVNIYTLFLSISQHTYLCPNSQNSGALYTDIEFYVSCQDFFLYISFFLAR